jgi:hypothetical protein
MYPGRSLSALLVLVSLTAGCEVVHFIGENTQPACQRDGDCAPSSICDAQRGSCVTPPSTAMLDILFVIDNSSSMVGRQKGLLASIGGFLRKLDANPIAVSYNIGIVTSDIGTDVAVDQQWGGGSPSCDTFAGDDGVLQATPCTSRPGLSPESLALCQLACPDPTFLPFNGGRFIAKSGLVTNVPFDLRIDPPDVKVDLGPQHAFGCLAVLGDSGCGIEGQLEAARRALDGHRPENIGFLRPDSLVAVIFMTDEDDCSIQPARRKEFSPLSFNCPLPSQNALPGCFNPDFRCLASDVVCDEPLDAAGDKHGCRERADSLLEPVQTYVDFFTKLRPANRIFLGGIWTLPALEQGGQLSVATMAGGGAGSDGLNRLSAPCSGVISTYPGAPQLRLSKLIQQFKVHLEADLCDAQGYPAALERMAALILNQAGVAAAP